MTPPIEDFVPPGAEEMRSHLDRHGPVARSPWQAWRPILLLAAALFLSATIDAWWAHTLPWFAIAAAIFFTTSRARRTEQLARQLTQLQEFVMLRRYVPALRLAWQILPRMTTIPSFHGRAVAFLAHGLDQVGAYDAAITTYDYMIDRLPSHHPGSQQMRIARSIAHLNNGQLADADRGLRGLRRQVAAQSYPPIQATLRFACLLQQIRTNHFAEACEEAETLQEGLRPLGVEAGYGHALMALAWHVQSDSPHHTHGGDEAATWWSRATRLLPPGVLTARFPELDTVNLSYPAAPTLSSVINAPATNVAGT